MKFSNRVLMVTTPVGVAIGLYEAYQLAGGLVVLMAIQMLLLTGIGIGVVRMVRRESKEVRS